MKSRKYERIAVLVFLIFSPFWLSALPPQVGSTLRAGFREQLLPVYEATESFRVGLETILFGFLQGPFLLEQNRVLRGERDLLARQEEIHRQLAKENERLRELLKFKQDSPYRLILAQVIARDFGPFSRTLILNKGTASGVRNGMAVVTPAALVGRVAEAGPRSSRVIGLTDPHFRISAVLAEKRTAGLVMGTASGDCLLTYLPKEGDFKIHQAVVTSGVSSFCPAGFLIGSLDQWAADPSGLFRSGRIKPAVPLASLEEVFVVQWPPSDSGPGSSS